MDDTSKLAQQKSSFDTRYGKELKRLYLFSLCLLPLLSICSILTGQYFVCQKLLAPSLPKLSPFLLIALSFLLVGIIELIKYFLSPLLGKSLFYRSYKLALPTFLLVLFFGSLSVYFSIQGLQDYFSDSHQKIQALTKAHQADLLKIQTAHDSLLQIKLEALDTLRSQLIQNPQVLKKQDKYLAHIQRLTTQKARDLKKGHDPDSIHSLYDARIARADKALRMLELSTAASKVSVQRSESIQSQIQQLDEDKNKFQERLQHDFEQEKNRLETESTYISQNLWGFSLSVEILLMLCLVFRQIYQLRFSGKEKPSSPLPAKPVLVTRRKRSDAAKSPKRLKASKKSRSPRRVLSDLEREEIKRRLDKGERPDTLAQEFGCSRRTVYRLRGRN